MGVERSKQKPRRVSSAASRGFTDHATRDIDHVFKTRFFRFDERVSTRTPRQTPQVAPLSEEGRVAGSPVATRNLSATHQRVHNYLDEDWLRRRSILLRKTGVEPM